MIVNGRPLAGKQPGDRIALLKENSPSAKRPLHLGVERGGNTTVGDITGRPCLKYEVALVQDDAEDAFADGSKIAVTSDMVRLTETDEERVFVLAYEIAHDALGHCGKKTGKVKMTETSGSSEVPILAVENDDDVPNHNPRR